MLRVCPPKRVRDPKGRSDMKWSWTVVLLVVVCACRAWAGITLLYTDSDRKLLVTDEDVSGGGPASVIINRTFEKVWDGSLNLSVTGTPSTWSATIAGVDVYGVDIQFDVTNTT